MHVDITFTYFWDAQTEGICKNSMLPALF